MAYTEQVRPQQDHGEDSYKGNGKLQGRIALVTGGDAGIGKAVAIAFAREGADIAFTYLDGKVEVEGASDTVRIIEEEGRRAFAVPGDVRDEKFVERLVEETMGEFGVIDVLVNNAAFQRSYEGIEQVPNDEFDRAFKTNIYGPFFLTRAIFPRMKPGSAIVNTISTEAFQPSPTFLPYAVTKGALATFTKAFAQEAIARGVRVNGVAPDQAASPAALAPIYVRLVTGSAGSVSGEIVSE